MTELPAVIELNLMQYNIPFLVTAHITHSGLETDFHDGKGRRPEPMVQFKVEFVNRMESQVENAYITLPTSAIPLMDDPSEHTLMSMLAFQTVFDNYDDEFPETKHQRLNAIAACRCYDEHYRALVEKPLAITPPPKTYRAHVDNHLIELSEIKLDTFYAAGQYTYKGYSVWLKRSFSRQKSTSNIVATSRWTFVNKEERWVVGDSCLVENKKTFTFSGGIQNYIPFEEVCKLID